VAVALIVPIVDVSADFMLLELYTTLVLSGFFVVGDVVDDVVVLVMDSVSVLLVVELVVVVEVLDVLLVIVELVVMVVLDVLLVVVELVVVVEVLVLLVVVVV
jgi:hypothetical protein